jgi:hypothetical protein
MFNPLQIGNGIPLVIVILVYIFALRPYARRLGDNYGYALFGKPAILAIVGGMIPTLLMWIGITEISIPNFSAITPELLEMAENPGISLQKVLPIPLLVEQGEGLWVIKNLFTIALWATPGVLIGTLVCLVKTKNLLIVLCNILILYFIGVTLGIVGVYAIIMVIIYALLVGFQEGARSTIVADHKCTKCGCPVTESANHCPSCGVSFR